MVNDVKLRLAGTNDTGDVAGLHAESWRQAYRGMLRDDYLDREIYSERAALWDERFRKPAENQLVVVAEVDGRAVAFACTYGNEDPFWGSFLDNLHVSAQFKRRGIGAALMRYTARWCEEKYPGRGMYLWVLASNTPAMRFYDSVGGVQSGEGLWTPPDGGEYRKLRYAWRSLSPLLMASR